MTADEVARLLRDNQRRLYCIARGMMRDEQEALDVVSEAACRAVSKAHALREPGAAVAWLSAIVVNCARSALRKRRPTLGEDALLFVSTPDETGDVDMRQMVECLPDREREVMLLRFYAELRPIEIARQLHLPESTVRARLKRALGSMRIQLEEVE